MVTITATDFKARCLEILDNVPVEGLAITKRGKKVAVLYPEGSDVRHLFGSIPDLHVEGDIFSTGIKWDAES